MRIGIQKRNNSFSKGWIEYCEKNGISYKLVDAYRNDIISQLDDCDAFMWHFHHTDYRDMQFAKSLLQSLEQRGTKVYPNSATCWHFDDKVAQKYLLESIGAPLVPSFVFYTEKDALKWVDETTFPKVFKLKGGAGASNVKLAKTKKDAIKFIRKCFGNGFRQYRFIEALQETYRKYKKGKATMRDVLRIIYNGVFKKYPSTFDHYHGKECGYAYFQEFIPDNKFDTRIIVINGEKAFGEKRFVRNNDFRASGSGEFSYNDIDERIVKIAFDISKKLNLQTVAFDFVISKENNPLIVEISYGFGTKGARNCPGYWTDDMQWHEGTGFDFCGWMVENLM